MLGFFERLFGLNNTEPQGVYKPFSDKETLEEAERVLSNLRNTKEERLKKMGKIAVLYDNLQSMGLALHDLMNEDPKELYKKDPERFKNVIRTIKKLQEKKEVAGNVELPSDVKARRVKEKFGYRREDGSVNPSYENIDVIKLEGPLFDPEQYNNEQKVKRELEKVEKSLREKPLPSEEDKTVRILPIEEPQPVRIVNKLEELVSYYDNDHSFKLIERENGKITNIKVDEKLYDGFLNRTFAATTEYLEADKGKKNSRQRSFFESLEDSVLGVWKEGFFNIESRLDPLNHGYRNKTVSKKLSYKEGISFEKQYNRVLYSSLDNFEGKNKDEQKVSKAKSLVSLLAEYIAFNADRIDRTTVLEYSRRINDYIKKHVKDESLRGELEISLSYDRERKTFTFKSGKESSVIYTLNNNSRKVELVNYVYHKHKDSDKTSDKKVEEANGKGNEKRRSFREIANDAVASILVSPGYLAGVAANLVGKGVEEIGKGLKVVGNYVLNGSDKARKGLTRPYTVVPVDEYNRLKAYVKNTSESGESEKNKNESSDN